jgi:hypothetical protein
MKKTDIQQAREDAIREQQTKDTWIEFAKLNGITKYKFV